MSATRCTCIRDAGFVRVVLDPTCPAWVLHVRFPTELPAGRTER